MQVSVAARAAVAAMRRDGVAGLAVVEALVVSGSRHMFPTMMESTNTPTPKTIVWRMIMQMVGAWELTGISMFSIIEKASGKWVGRAGPWQPL